MAEPSGQDSDRSLRPTTGRFPVVGPRERVPVAEGGPVRTAAEWIAVTQSGAVTTKGRGRRAERGAFTTAA
jgi:hypothetical protein